ncbi:MAG: signal peptide peptidase SppA [Vampirovibrio sp.]|nr:signal peptide peptidase SppA [Vampirovibrio sp.]
MGLCKKLKKLMRSMTKDERIALVEMDGLIASQKNLSTAPQVLQLLEEVKQQEYKALVLRVNSPGGTVGMSQEIYEAILNLKKEKGTKVVASLGDVAASGGVYIAMAADEIIANGGTVTGSIGVIIKSGNFRELLDKIGIQSDVVKSGKYKDLLSTDRAMSEEEKALLQETIDDTYSQFVSVVAKGREMSEETVKTFADGRVFTGQQAKGLGLVDELGSLDVAVEKVRVLAGFKTEGPPKVTRMEKKRALINRMLENSKMGVLPGQAVNNWMEMTQQLSGVPLWLMPTYLK